MTSEEKVSEILDWVQDALNANWGFMCCLKEDLKDLVAIAQAEHAAVRVEVVRCKDCKHWGTGYGGETEHVKVCEFANYMVGENGYCVYGERMEEHAAD